MEDEIDTQPPFRLLARPPQFPQGKTATAIEAMKAIIAMMVWIFNHAQTPDLNNLFHRKKYKRIVHLIFVNNNLIEGDQWENRLIRRGVQNAKIFSSKSDVSDADTLLKLITQGEFKEDKYIAVDYVLMCTHPTRLKNFTGEDNGDSILKRLETFYPEIGVMTWFDEMDKFVKLFQEHLPKFQSFTNIIKMTGITATPYKKFWEIMHSCGYGDAELLGQLPDPSHYRTLVDHEIIPTDAIGLKCPVKNFEYILNNPGGTIGLPDLNTNTGKILFVPGKNTCKSHEAIRDLALERGKNVLVINGRNKAFYLPGQMPIELYDYKRAMVKKQAVDQEAGIEIPEDDLFENMSAMDVAVKMYHDPALPLRDTDLVITGFYCVERGVTFNRPDFQFSYAILAPYHYKEGSDEIESIIQLCGRMHGSKDWVKEICVLAPKYLVDEVNRAIRDFLAFLLSRPTKINYASVFRGTNGIPILCQFHDSAFAKVFQQLCSKGRIHDSLRKEIVACLQFGLARGFVTLEDRNIHTLGYVPFNLKDYTLSNKRVCESQEKAKSYRFAQFYQNFQKQKVYGQSTQIGEFAIDLTLVPIVVDETTTLPAGTTFLSFSFLSAEFEFEEEEVV